VVFLWGLLLVAVGICLSNAFIIVPAVGIASVIIIGILLPKPLRITIAKPKKHAALVRLNPTFGVPKSLSGLGFRARVSQFEIRRFGRFVRIVETI